MHLSTFFAILLSMHLISAQLEPIHPDHSCSAQEAFLHDGFYYQFFDCPMTWNDAEETCASGMVVNGRSVLGGHLVSVLSKEESNWLQFQINQRYGRHVGFWIGLRRALGGRKPCPVPATWTDGNDVSFTNFGNNEPDCRWPEEDCFHLAKNQLWGDAECTALMRFVCKISPSEFAKEQTTAETEEPSGQTDQSIPSTGFVPDNSLTKQSTPEPPTPETSHPIAFETKKPGTDDNDLPPPPPPGGK